MTPTERMELYRTDLIRFGKNEGHALEIFNKKQQNQNFSQKKEKENRLKKETESLSFIDRSSFLNGSLNLLALFNMIGIKTPYINKPDLLINEKGVNENKIFNPFINS